MPGAPLDVDELEILMLEVLPPMEPCRCLPLLAFPGDTFLPSFPRNISPKKLGNIVWPVCYATPKYSLKWPTLESTSNRKKRKKEKKRKKKDFFSFILFSITIITLITINFFY
jgi:hypothetical protein